MKLANKTIIDFTEVLASSEPAPGGGSTAALEGALAASLVEMVTGLTIGKKKYAEHDDLMKEIGLQAAKLRAELTDVIDRDTEAFNGVSAVFAMPKETDEEKSLRSDAMQQALKACTLTPFEMMQCALAVLELAEKMLGKFNSSAASDLGVAALSAKAAAQGAWLNILINIGGIKDEAFTGKYRGGGEAILAKALPLADKIYAHVLDCV
ncbi:MAG: cyclodeaminase/cyclohydrolase family protein [Treponema sp.]|jgi:formiminotetrahydrofolate cyclodeaminase|nr:cyclodeaminase/cyclohydrolase family protein [Treponema sp.]